MPVRRHPPALVRAVWTAWDWLARLTWWLNVPACARAFRDVLGAEPITFYEPPDRRTRDRRHDGRNGVPAHPQANS
jgi:hypothetical protein